MTSTPTRIRNDILARIDASPLTGSRSERVHALLGLALDAIEEVQRRAMVPKEVSR